MHDTSSPLADRYKSTIELRYWHLIVVVYSWATREINNYVGKGRVPIRGVQYAAT